MAFNNPTNQGRVARIIAALDNIETSGKANRASPEEFAAMLAPVTERIAALTGGTPAPAQPAPTATGPRPPAWVDIRTAAEGAPLRDTPAAMEALVNRIVALVDAHTAAMAVMLNRIDALVDAHPEKETAR